MREEQRIPLKHWVSGFCSTPQVVEVPERNSGNTASEDHCLHTFLKNRHTVWKELKASVRKRAKMESTLAESSSK